MGKIQTGLSGVMLMLACGAAAICANSAPCCGEVSAAGHRLTDFLNGMDVESLWLAHEHVNWKTGRPDRGAEYEGPGRATHCSAFAAAVGQRLGVYMLRPPEHGLILLASAQAKWFSSEEARERGWQRIAGPREAQTGANEGQLVVVVFQNPDPHRPGHIAVVRPSEKPASELHEDGPQVIQAGQHNHNSTTVRDGFRSHPGAWPEGVHYYAHQVDWTHLD